MKKASFLLLTFLSFTTIIFAQNYPTKSLEDFHFSIISNKTGTENHIDYSNIKGSPFLNNEFKNGEVTTTSNTVISNVLLRYNIYADEIEFEEENKKTFYLDKSIVKIIKIADLEFIYKAYSMGNKLGRSYFEVLLRGKATLLKRYRVTFEEAKPPKAYEDPTPPQFKPAKADYYIAFGEAEANRISGSKQLTEMLPDKETEITEYIKKNKLKTGNQEDLIRVIQFYNTGE